MFLLGLLVFIAVMILRTGKLFAVIVMSGGYSLASAAIFVNLDAVDVAFTEAAVGAGISTVLFLAAMSFLPAEEKAASNRDSTLTDVYCQHRLRGCQGCWFLPRLTCQPLAIRMHPPMCMWRRVFESGMLLHIPNVVTTVLASYRGFDTLGETIVVFTAGLGVLMLLAGATRTRRPDSAQSPVQFTARGKAKKGGQNEKQSSISHCCQNLVRANYIVWPLCPIPR